MSSKEKEREKTQTPPSTIATSTANSAVGTRSIDAVEKDRVKPASKNAAKTKTVVEKTTGGGKKAAKSVHTPLVRRPLAPSAAARPSSSSRDNLDLKQQIAKLGKQQDQLMQAMFYYGNHDDENQYENADFLGDYDFDLEPAEEYDYESDGGSILDLNDQDLARQKPDATGASDQDGVAPDVDEDAEEIGFAARFAVAADRGNPIDSNIAISLKYLMSTKINETVLTETLDRYGRPPNCKVLVAPKVNPQIWDNVNARTRSVDLKLQKVQKSVVKGITAFCSGLDNITSQQQDTLALFANANYEMNMLRRELIKPDLNPRFGHLCKSSVKVTDLLFGDNLPQQMKNIQEEQKATNVTRGSTSSNRFHPYQAASFRGRRGRRFASYAQQAARPGPFLGNRQFQYRPSNRGSMSSRNRAPQQRRRQAAAAPAKQERTQ